MPKSTEVDKQVFDIGVFFWHPPTDIVRTLLTPWARKVVRYANFNLDASQDSLDDCTKRSQQVFPPCREPLP
jgi:hypothetical protein